VRRELHPPGGVEMDMRLALYFFAIALAAAQSTDYPREQENALHPTTPAKRLFPDDAPCGGYLWKSTHQAELHMVAIYYFFGSTDYGKSKMGLYSHDKVRVEVDERRDPPTAQVVMADGKVKEILIRMTGKEYQAAGQCFPSR
jgi:hypothetical protein